MNKIKVIIAILVFIGGGAKLYTNYMRMQNDSSNAKTDERLNKEDRQKLDNEISEIIKLITEEKYQEVIEKSNILIKKYKGNSNAKLNLASLIALKARAESYDQLKQFKNAEEDYKNFINDAKNVKELKKSLIAAHVQLIFLQYNNDFIQPEEGVIFIDEYIGKYGNNSDFSIQNAGVLLVKGSFEQDMNQLKESLISFQKSEDTLLEFVNTQPDQKELIKELLSFNQIGKATVLGEMGQTQEAFNLLENIKSEVVTSNSKNTDELLIGVDIAKGYLSLISAKINWSNEEIRSQFLTKGITVLEEARISNKKLTNQKDQDSNLATILGNEAYIVYLLDDNNALAQEKLVESFSLKGEKLYKGTLRDISLYPIEEKDAGFNELVKSAWTQVQGTK